MVKILDLSFSKEELATYLYICLEAGVKFNSLDDVKGVVYTLKQNLNLDTSNGVLITSSLKEQLRSILSDFKSYENYPNYTYLATVTSKDTEFVLDPNYFDNELDVKFKIPYVIKPVIGNEPTNTSHSVIFRTKRKSDGHISTVTGNITAIKGYKKIELYITQGSSSTRLEYIVYGEDDTVLKTAGTSMINTGFNTWQLGFSRVSNTKPLELHSDTSLTFDVPIENFRDINIDNLAEVTYKANDYLPILPLTIDNVIGKLKDNVYSENPLEFIEHRRLSSNLNDGKCNKFHTVFNLENEEVHILSTYPLYCTGTVNNIPTFGGIDNLSKEFYLESYSISNGILNTYDLNLRIEEFGYNIENNYISIGEVIDSNYPIYYSAVKNVNSTDSDDNFKPVNRLILYRKPVDKTITLEYMPPGATVYFGRHAVEDSEVKELPILLMDYCENLEGYNSNAVLFRSLNAIDSLQGGTYYRSTYTIPELQGYNSPLMRYLSSSKINWHEPLFAEDLPPTAEYSHSSYGTKDYYAHRRGFLSYFTAPERDMLIEFETDRKVSLLKSNESSPRTTNIKGTKPYLITGGSFLEINASPLLANHINTSVRGIGELLDEYTGSFIIDYYWRNDYNGEGRQAYTVKSSAVYANLFYGYYIVPTFLLSKDTVVLDVDDLGIFKLEIKEPEGIITTSSSRLIKEVRNTVTSSVKLKKSVISKVINSVLAVKKNVINTNLSAKLVKKLNIKTNSKARLKRVNRVTILNSYKLIKTVEGNVKSSAILKKEVVKNINNTVNITRNVVKNTSSNHSLKKINLISVFVNSSFTRYSYKRINFTEKLIKVNTVNTSTVSRLVRIVRIMPKSTVLLRRETVKDVNTSTSVKKLTVVNLNPATARYRVLKNSNVNTISTHRLVKTVEASLEKVNYSMFLAKTTVKSIFDTSLAVKINTVKSSRSPMFVKSVKVYNLKPKAILLSVKSEKDSIGISKITYEELKKLNCRIYPVKTYLKELPIGVSGDNEYVIVTKDRTISKENKIKLNNKIYEIDAIIDSRINKQVFIKEL